MDTEIILMMVCLVLVELNKMQGNKKTAFFYACLSTIYLGLGIHSLIRGV